MNFETIFQYFSNMFDYRIKNYDFMDNYLIFTN